MRRLLIPVLLVLAFAAPALSQEFSGCCTTPQGVQYEAASVFGSGNHGCATGDAWVATPCPTATPVPPVPGGWWDLVKAYADKVSIWHGDAASVARLLALLASFLGIVQAFKKGLESLAKWEWLLKVIPQLAVVFAFFAHGVGPIILNALITGGTLLTAAVQDGALSLGEVLAILLAVGGVDVLYRLVRKYLFPKSATI